MSVEHWMVFGTFAEQRHFEYPARGTYHGVIINANMAAYAPEGLAAFLLEKTAGMKYLIDPLTHAFQHDPEAITDGEGKPRSSIRSLAEAYGEPVVSRLGCRPLQPADLDSAHLPGFVERCIRFQERQLKERMEESRVSKYLEDGDQFSPSALVAPYFYMTESTLNDWLSVNIDASRIAASTVDRSRFRCFASVVVSKGVVTDPAARNAVIRGYSSVDLDGYLLWVDALDEQAASSSELVGIMELARGLRAGGSRSVINLHGGYFSVLAAGELGQSAMTGVAHGPEFGEYREVVPVGGGIPIARYYIPQLHSRVRYRDALRFFSTAGWLADAALFHKEVCGCDECRSVLGGASANFQLFGEGTAKSVARRNGLVRIEFPTAETKLRCLRHYLQCKNREYTAGSQADRATLLANLKAGESKYRPIAGLDPVAHLRLWQSVFTG